MHLLQPGLTQPCMVQALARLVRHIAAARAAATGDATIPAATMLKNAKLLAYPLSRRMHIIRRLLMGLDAPGPACEAP